MHRLGAVIVVSVLLAAVVNAHTYPQIVDQLGIKDPEQQQEGESPAN